LSAPTDNQIHAVPANQFSPSAGTTLSINAIQFSPSPGTTLTKPEKRKAIRTKESGPLPVEAEVRRTPRLLLTGERLPHGSIPQMDNHDEVFNSLIREWIVQKAEVLAGRAEC